MKPTATKKKPDEAQLRKHKALMQSVTMPGQRDSATVPMASREAPVQNVDAKERTFDVVWTAGARVRRYDWYRSRWYWEELSMEPAHVRMGRLQSGRAPVLDSHWGYRLADVLGVVNSASLSAKEGRCKIKLSQRDDVADVITDVRDGIIANVSVGYNFYRIEMLEPAKEGELWVYRVVDWEPLEVSLVPMPADEAAGIREGDDDERFKRCEYIDSNPPARAGSTKEADMAFLVSLARALGIKSPEGAEEAAVRSAVITHLKLKEDASDDDITAAALKRNEPAPAPSPAAPADPVTVASAESKAREQERQRTADIMAFCEKHRALPEFQQKAIKDNWTVDRTARELLNERAEKGDTTGPSPIPSNQHQRQQGSWDSVVQSRGGK